MDLLRDYMNEHYAAARNQQMMRLQAMALYVSASAILFVQAVLHYTNHVAGYVIGAVMLLLAALCLYQNTVFHRANRYHVEVARQARKQITNVLKGGASLAQNDPNLIGEVVRSNFGIKLTDDVFEKCLNEASQDRLPKSSFKVEGWLHRSLFIIPVLIGLGGIVLIGYFAWIGKLICTLCPQ
jgi:hypothetical protein